MTIPDNLQTLIERRNWLSARIRAKESVDWDTAYDVREHRALSWAVKILAQPAEPAVLGHIRSMLVRFQKWRVRQEGVG